MTYQILFLGSPLLPAAIAHGLCVKYDWLKWLKRPLDFGGRFKGKRIFGDHKTWRAPCIYVVFCTLGTMVQAWLQGRGYLPQWLCLVDYERCGTLVGVLMGLGMSAGELPNSFLKRQLDVAPGKRKKGLLGIAFFLFDQLDLAVGIWAFLFLLIRPSWVLVAWSFLLAIALHAAVSTVGYLLGMRDTIA
ncbi:MAG: CDP-archaeol synthase [Desulfobacteraceae bacterium]|jgi:hypothetical protein